MKHEYDLVLKEIKLPALKEHQVYVRVDYEAFNPTDRLAFDLNAFGNGAVLGCDFAGVVTQIHDSVTKLAPGDRVAALVWGSEERELGAYSTYSIADERLSFKIPADLDHVEACAVPLAANTAWLALFSNDCLSLSRSLSDPPPQLLVWGGSSTVRYFAIQIAKLHSCVVATTCSPRNFERARAAGAAYVFDYIDVDIVTKIRDVLPNLQHIFDAIGNTTSSVTTAQAMSNKFGGVLCTVRPGKANTEGVGPEIKVTDVFVFTAFPTPHSYRGVAFWPTHLEDHSFSGELYAQLPTLLREGRPRPPPVTILGELSPAVLKRAMDMNREGRISGQKVCFKVGDMK